MTMHDILHEAAANDVPELFAGWAIVEMFGHRRIAGLVTADSADIMTATRLRVDIYPGAATQATLTQFVTYPAAVYCLTPASEDICRALAARTEIGPVARWELDRGLDDASPF